MRRENSAKNSAIAEKSAARNSAMFHFDGILRLRILSGSQNRTIKAVRFTIWQCIWLAARELMDKEISPDFTVN